MITIICGVPGKGKTALATQLTLEQAKKGRVIFSNYNISWSQFGHKLSSFDSLPEYFKERKFPYGAYVNLDEAQNDYNSRYFKDMTKDEIKYFTGHRHLGIDIVMTTQHPNRIDVIMREIADNFLWIRYSLPFGFKICYEYYLADHVGKLPPEVEKDFVKLRIKKVSKATYTKYDDKYLKNKIKTNIPDGFTQFDYQRSKYIPLYLRIYTALKQKFKYDYELIKTSPYWTTLKRRKL